MYTWMHFSNNAASSGQLDTFQQHLSYLRALGHNSVSMVCTSTVHLVHISAEQLPALGSWVPHTVNTMLNGSRVCTPDIDLYYMTTSLCVYICTPKTDGSPLLRTTIHTISNEWSTRWAVVCVYVQIGVWPLYCKVTTTYHLHGSSNKQSSGQQRVQRKNVPRGAGLLG